MRVVGGGGAGGGRSEMGKRSYGIHTYPHTSTRTHTHPHARTHNGFHFLRCPPAFMNISGFVTSIAAAYKAFRHGDNFTR